MFNHRLQRSIGIAVIVVTFGTVIGVQTTLAKTQKTTFIENFATTKNRDKKATTAVWDINNSVGRLPKSKNPKTWEVSTGLPEMDAAVVGADQDMWLIGGGVHESGGTRSILYRYHNGTFTKIPTSFQFSISAVASNGSYWLLGVKDELYKYDGTSFTNLTSQLPPVFGAVHEILWKDNIWMMTGSNNVAIMYDGSTFTNLDAAGTNNATLAFANGVTIHASWEDTWLFGGTDGRMFTFDGTDATEITSPFSSGGQIYALANDGENWLIGGSINNSSVLYLYDGETFTKLDSLRSTEARITNIAWSGDTWILTINTTPSDALYALSQNGSSLIQLSYKNAGMYVFAQNQITQTTSGWVISGTLANGTSTSFIVQFSPPYQSNKLLQSKSVSTKDVLVKDVTLTSVTNIPSKTKVQFSVSNDNGKTWKEAKNGSKVVFSQKNKHLLWRAVLTTKDPYTTPTVTKVSLDYTYKE